MQTTKWIAAAIAVAIGLGLAPQPGSGPDGTGGSTVSMHLGVGVAEAQPARRMVRRTARRTTRRTVARHNYYSSLPAGCAFRGGYHYCGGVYYQPVVQGGQTVYIIVNP